MLEFVEHDQQSNGLLRETSVPVTLATPDDLRIDLLAQSQLHDFWPLLKRGLTDILKKAHPCPDWIPEDVYAYLRNGQAAGYLAFHRGRYVAFVVCYLNPLPFSGKQEMIAWAGWGLPLKERYPNDDPDRVWALLWNVMREAGRRAGAIRLKTLSTRPGMKKQAAKVGLIPSFTTYECAL